MTKQDCHAHVRPKGQATGDEPTRPIRQRDLVEYRARLLGYRAMCHAAKDGKPDFLDWCSGLDLMQDYLRTWDRRRTVAPEVKELEEP